MWDASKNDINFIGGCRIKILLREWALLILTGGMRDEKQEITRYGRKIATLTGRDCDKYSDWSGMTRGIGDTNTGESGI